MPSIGEIKRAMDTGNKGFHKRIWNACEVCGKERWVWLRKGKPANPCCNPCAARAAAQARKKRGEHGNRWGWGGGRFKDRDGYIRVRIDMGDFFAPMALSSGYVTEHRLVMAKHLGRCLHRWEIVHHKNGVKDDNRIKNLELTMGFNHQSQHRMQERIEQLESRVTLLEAENALLRMSARGMEV